MEDTFFEAKYPGASRKEEISQVLSFVKQGKSSQIISIPGVGRTTFLGLLAYNKHVRDFHLQDAKEHYHFVMVEFEEIRNKPPLEALKLIFLDIVSSLEDRPLGDTYEKAKHILQESLSYNDELVLFQGLKKTLDMLLFDNGMSVVLLFDKFDSYIPMLTTEFFLHLRNLRTRAKHKLSIVFSLDKPLEYFLDSTLFADFSEFVEGNTVYLHLHDEVSLSFHLQFIEHMMGTSLDEAAKKQLFLLTAGHNKLSRLGIQTLLSQTTQEDMASFLLSQKPIHAVLTDIWQRLNPAEQTHFLKKLYPNILDDEHTQYLSKVGLMSKDTITLPLFEAFTDEKRREQKTDTSHITLDVATGAIQKGDQNISDMLTATELRLLRFLVETPDTILDRNTIIQSVWKETKTVLGVTDQALDQIIFRLRRKIEDDPNTPSHIQTIKGRGFRFIP